MSSKVKYYEECIKLIKDIENRINREDYHTASNTLEKLLYKHESILLHLRRLYCSINRNFPNKIADYYRQSAQTLDMAVQKCTEYPFDVYKIKLPFLLPNKRSKWNLFKDTIGNTLYYLLENYCKDNFIEPFLKSTIVVLTYYNPTDSLYINDNDNKEESDIINLLINRFIRDDNGLVCDICNLCRETLENTRTEIYIMNQSDFLPFINIKQL